MAKKKSDNAATRTFVREGAPPSISLSDYRLVVVEGPDKGKEVLLNKDKVSVGSGAKNSFQLSDDTVSREHCEFVKFSDTYMLKDLGSTNGTLLDGTGVREAFVRPGAIIEMGQTSMQVQSRSEEIEIKPSEQDQFGDLFGKSIRMREVFSILERVAPSEATVLIQGETGTGKEVVAREIHRHSRRKDKSMVVFDCSAVAPNLVESELFGHVRGAFTGAVSDRRGAFEMANGGTIFLDEIGELTEDLQPKLLRALEQKEIRQVGGEKSIRVDVRVIAATNRDLEEEVAAGRFREDLFFRLSVIPVRIPALRHRREDVPVLVDSFFDEIKAKMGADKAKGVSKKAMELLMEYAWPGNVRELRNVIEGAVAMSDQAKLEPRDFIFFSKQKGKQPDASADALIGKSLEQVEKTVIEGTLRSNKGNKMATAKILGIAYSTLYEKIKKYGINA